MHQIRQHIQLLTQLTIMTTNVEEEKETNTDIKKMTSEIIAKTLEVGHPGDTQFVVHGPEGEVITTNSVEQVRGARISQADTHPVLGDS